MTGIFRIVDVPSRGHRPRSGRLGPVLTLLIASAGCGGDDLGRRPISGDVTLDGRPLAEGFVLFEPAAGDEAGTAVGASIRRGRFSVSRHEGPVAGSYKVRIYASSGVQADPPPNSSAGSPRPMIDLIPARYNRRTTLGAEVTADGSNAFRFDLDSDAKTPAR